MILLDTCTLLWLAADPGRLSPLARERIAANAGRLYVSAITGFEIALKHRKGRLTLPMEPSRWMARVLDHHGVVDVPITWQIAGRSAAVPLQQGDPCDRIIAATAEALKLTVLTPDPLIAAWKAISVEW